LTIAPDGSSAAVSEPLAAIDLSDVSVKYTIPTDRVVSFKEYIVRRISGKLQFHDLWALKGLSLRIGAGEAFGIVGQNGAGKSTLLKVIARVLRPTSGRIIVRGRVAPLLELGAGFHPDLSGRENVYLNGTLLGYPQPAIEEHFDEVIAFSELGEFVHLPIRNYSTGMVARLGFAVATMFRPDVLILDEVLAVGDSRFQEKCLKRISEFQAQGTTVLLVSHSLQAVADFCQQCVWIEHGELRACGPTHDVLDHYSQALNLYTPS